MTKKNHHLHNMYTNPTSTTFIQPCKLHNLHEHSIKDHPLLHKQRIPRLIIRPPLNQSPPTSRVLLTHKVGRVGAKHREPVRLQQRLQLPEVDDVVSRLVQPQRTRCRTAQVAPGSGSGTRRSPSVCTKNSDVRFVLHRFRHCQRRMPGLARRGRPSRLASRVHLSPVAHFLDVHE